jgi:hypothetical protein
MSKVGGKKKDDIYDEIEVLEGGSGFAKGSIRDTGEGNTKGISGDGVKKYKKIGGFNFIEDILKSPENIATSLLATSPIAPITPIVSAYLFGKKFLGGKAGKGISGGKLVPKSEMQGSTLSGFGKSGGGVSGGAFNPLDLLNPVGLVAKLLGGKKLTKKEMQVLMKEGSGMSGGACGCPIRCEGMCGGKKMKGGAFNPLDLLNPVGLVAKLLGGGKDLKETRKKIQDILQKFDRVYAKKHKNSDERQKEIDKLYEELNYEVETEHYQKKGKQSERDTGYGITGGKKMKGGAFNPLDLLNPVGMITKLITGGKKKTAIKEGKGISGGSLSERKGMGISGGGISGGKKLTPWTMLVKETLEDKKLGLKGVKEAVKYIKDNNLYKK